MRPAAALLALALCAGGCSEGSSPVPTAAALGLGGELRQYREDQAPRVVQVGVTARDGVTVLGALLRAPGFAPVPRTAREDPVPAGQRVDVPVPYGEVDCGVSPGPATVLLAVRTATGQDLEVVLPVADPSSVLTRVHLDDCRVRAVSEQVRLSLVGPWRAGDPADPVRRGGIRLERVSGTAEVRVVELQRNTLFAVAAPALAVLQPGSQAAEQGLEVRPIARCNVHALAESKRATIFGLYLSVGGAEPVLVTVGADERLRSELLAFAGAGCGSP